MDTSQSPTSGYLLAALLGATVGGVAVAMVTRAIPTMLSRMMPIMMRNMIVYMGSEGCDPDEM